MSAWIWFNYRFQKCSFWELNPGHWKCLNKLNRWKYQTLYAITAYYLKGRNFCERNYCGIIANWPQITPYRDKILPWWRRFVLIWSYPGLFYVLKLKKSFDCRKPGHIKELQKKRLRFAISCLRICSKFVIFNSAIISCAGISCAVISSLKVADRL